MLYNFTELTFRMREVSGYNLGRAILSKFVMPFLITPKQG
jgi:hypothetical protein